MKQYLKNELEEAARIVNAVGTDAAVAESIEKAARLVVQCLRNGSKVLFAGNGGSAADAQHMAGEFVSRFAMERPGLHAMALTTDTSVLTAIGNDYGYEQLFSRQIQALGNKGDVLFAYSTSGRSPNILAGLEKARSAGLTTIGLSGSREGPMQQMCDVFLAAPSTSTPRIQEVHLLMGHIICGLVEREMFASALVLQQHCGDSTNATLP